MTALSAAHKSDFTLQVEFFCVYMCHINYGCLDYPPFRSTSRDSTEYCEDQKDYSIISSQSSKEAEHLCRHCSLITTVVVCNNQKCSEWLWSGERSFHQHHWDCCCVHKFWNLLMYDTESCSTTCNTPWHVLVFVSLVLSNYTYVTKLLCPFLSKPVSVDFQLHFQALSFYFCGCPYKRAKKQCEHRYCPQI